MIERGDHHVIDEPFSAVYYLGPERISDRYPMTEPESTAAQVFDLIGEAPTPTFVKDMIHHVPPARRHDVAVLGQHTLLTRDPRRAIPSFAAVWPDVTWDECGYEALVEFADHLDGAGLPFDVVDAMDLTIDPETTLRAWCSRHELDFDPATLQWDAGPVPQWTRWLEFHDSSVRSTGFSPSAQTPPPAVDDRRVAMLVERAVPLHARLLERSITS